MCVPPSFLPVPHKSPALGWSSPHILPAHSRSMTHDPECLAGQPLRTCVVVSSHVKLLSPFCASSCPIAVYLFPSTHLAAYRTRQINIRKCFQSHSRLSPAPISLSFHPPYLLPWGGVGRAFSFLVEAKAYISGLNLRLVIIWLSIFVIAYWTINIKWMIFLDKNYISTKLKLKTNLDLFCPFLLCP